MRNQNFKHFEKKYVLDEKQYCILKIELDKYMCIDEYGEYTISNIYYDTNDLSLIRNSISKPIYKEKLHLRSYGVPNRNTN